MKISSSTLLVLTAGSVLFATLGGCKDKLSPCEERLTCLDSGDGDATSSGGGNASSGDGDGDGDTSSGGLGNGDGDGDTSTGGDGDTSGSGGEIIDPCSLCESETPVCVNDECVACSETDTGSCNEDQVCSPDNTCVECLDNTHCTEADASVCDLDTNTCTGCEDNDSCAHLEDTAVCDTESKTCVECTVETEAEQCDLTACNPATFTCTKKTRGTSKACEACVADSECRPGYHCVPMTYQGPDDATPQDRGGYCLKTNEEGCTEPYGISLANRTTLSGTTGSSYCGINEALTTCEAVLALSSNMTCPSGEECPEGGECRKVGDLTPNRCTYKCSGAAQCDQSPNPGSTCGDGTADDLDTANFYCGG